MRLSELLHIDIVDEDGKALGSLMELRCRSGASRGRTRSEARVDVLVFAMPGLLEHIGVRQAKSCEVTWKDVVGVERDRIVIRRNKHKRAM